MKSDLCAPGRSLGRGRRRGRTHVKTKGQQRHENTARVTSLKQTGQTASGVHGDRRAYGYVNTIRAVQSIDAMTCAYSKIPHEVIDRISIHITNSLKDKVNRVVYDVSNKPPSTVEWE